MNVLFIFKCTIFHGFCNSFRHSTEVLNSIICQYIYYKMLFHSGFLRSHWFYFHGFVFCLTLNNEISENTNTAKIMRAYMQYLFRASISLFKEARQCIENCRRELPLQSGSKCRSITTCTIEVRKQYHWATSHFATWQFLSLSESISFASAFSTI